MLPCRDRHLGAVAGDVEGKAVLAERHLDLHLPGQSGIEAIARLRAEHPDLAILAMTMSGADDDIVAALRAGARGYLLKSAGRAEVLHAIKGVGRGSAVLSAEVAARLASLAARH